MSTDHLIEEVKTGQIDINIETKDDNIRESHSELQHN
jgi:hypothetical protein